MQKLFLAAVCAISVVFVSRAANSEPYPSRPITMIVPFGPGGPTDTIARIIAARMTTSLGQPVIIKNVAGAAGLIGVAEVAQAVPDGYTLSIGHWSTHAVNSLINPRLKGILNKLQPIATLTDNPYLILSKRTVPATDLKGLIAWLKEKGGEALSPTNGPGSAGYLIGTLFKDATHTRFQLVPYGSGIGASKEDLIAGRIDLMFDQVVTSLPLISAGLAKGYAVTAKARVTIAPDIPTVDQAGLPGFYISAWHGLWVPKGTPQAIIAKIHTAIVTALADSEVHDKLIKLGQEIPPRAEQTPDALATRQHAEIDKWRPILEASQLQAH